MFVSVCAWVCFSVCVGKVYYKEIPKSHNKNIQLGLVYLQKNVYGTYICYRVRIFLLKILVYRRI